MPEEYPATTLLLIRHGQARASDGSYDENTPLTELGHRQSGQLADALTARTRPVVAYSSPYPRALETATPLCQQLAVRPCVDPRLAEFQLGTGSFESIQQRLDLLLWRPEHRGVENGETLGEFSARIAAFCNEVVERHPREDIAVFAHSGTIDAAIRWALGFPLDSLWQHEFVLATASITEIEFWPHGRIRGGAPRYSVIQRIGDVAHLGGLYSEI
ncbi:histidine phosphatase family protein [soil metagenome]